MAYLTASEALPILQKFDSSFALSDISALELTIAEAKVDSDLVEARVTTVPATDDTHSFLKLATLLFLVDWYCSMGKISSTTGRIIQSQLGSAMTRYAKEPMFFMRTGNTGRPISDLRDSETISQTARKFVRAYLAFHFQENYTDKVVRSSVKHDHTTNGYGSNVGSTVVNAADLESQNEVD